MAELPTGTVTFVFTDVEGSTLMLEHLGDEAFERALADHYRILREAAGSYGGVEVNTQGDSFFVVFANAADALAAALSAQLALERHRWDGDLPVRVRMGVHTGEGRRGGRDYVGRAVHEAARIASAAHGGQIVVSEKTRQELGVVHPPTSLRSLGRHRLKDLGAPLELHQVCHPELRGDFPALRSLEPVSHNLPVQLSSFLGRTQELARGADLLRGTRLLTIVGPGGIGKTRLAYQLAGEQMTEYPDGVWVAELAEVSDPARVGPALMTAIGLRDEPGRGATETLVAFLRSRQALVVLDNCEHLVAAAAALAAELLRGSANVRILATTREPLRVAGETVWALEPLTLPPDAEMSVTELAHADAVALFCERAAEAGAGFALTPTNSAAVTRICVRVEGLPLAIELAAARVRSLPVAEIAQRLDYSLDLLSKGLRGAGDRRASLRGAIAWSHALLTEPEQILFRRLALFAGGFTVEAAEGVCAGEELAVGEIIDVLDGLVDKSLVGLASGPLGERYRMLETIRAYAAERVHAAGEAQEVAEHHAAFYAKLAHDYARSDNAAAAVDQLEADHANLLAALDHLCRSDLPVEHGALVSDLSSFWALRGHWQLACRELERYVSRTNKERATEGRCLRLLGRMLLSLSVHEEAGVRIREALNIAREIGDRSLECECACGLGYVAMHTGDYIEARPWFEASLSMARALGDRRLECECVGGLAGLLIDLGEYPAGRSQMEAALSIARDLGDRNLESKWLSGLGSLARMVGDYPQARARNQEAIVIARELGDRYLEGYCAGCLGNAAVSLGDHAEARACFEDALVIVREIGDRRLEGYWTSSLGELALSLGDYAEARSRNELAVDIAREIGNRRLEGYCLAVLGDAAIGASDHHEANARLQEALLIARELGELGLERVVLRSQGDAAVAAGDFSRARAVYAAALDIARRADQQDCDLLEGCADILVRLDRCEDATGLLAAAQSLGATAGRVRSAWAQARYDNTRATCAGKLDEETVAAAWQRGGALDWPSAVDAAAYILDRLTRSSR
jgi:predicted ATPase/class 3 adenylate cyclase